ATVPTPRYVLPSHIDQRNRRLSGAQRCRVRDDAAQSELMSFRDPEPSVMATRTSLLSEYAKSVLSGENAMPTSSPALSVATTCEPSRFRTISDIATPGLPCRTNPSRPFRDHPW